jgi:hypothetical protein
MRNKRSIQTFLASFRLIYSRSLAGPVMVIYMTISWILTVKRSTDDVSLTVTVNVVHRFSCL